MSSSLSAALEPAPESVPASPFGMSGSETLPTPETLPAGDPNPQSYAPVVENLAEVGELAKAPATAPLSAGAAGLPDHVKRHVLSGTSALGASVFLERGTGFLANILAARLGGAATFGAYSLALSTASQISTNAGGGIGATAVRFSGKYQHGSEGYASLLRVLAIISLVSAAVASAGLWLGAAPIAHLLGKPSLVTLLRCAWVSAAGVVLLECARGFFVGQRYVAALLSMSLTVGAGMVFLLPYAAHRHSPTMMIESQGLIALGAVGLCVFFSRQLGWRSEAPPKPRGPIGPMLREVWSFGFVQLAGLVGSNLAGWWATALVARSDSTLIEISFFTIASQLRNLVSLPSSLLAEGSYAVMADPLHAETKTPQRVMALCCFAALSVSVLLGSLAIVIVPWGLTLLYGKTYAAAGAAVAMGLATAVAHMGTAPAANRLTIVSIRATAVINTTWAVFVAIAATVVLSHGGSAWHAMAIFFCAYALSSFLILFTLKRRDHLPGGLIGLFSFSVLSMSAMSAISIWRGYHRNLLAATGCMALLYVLTGAGLYLFGRRYGWLPPRTAVASLWSSLGHRLPGAARRRVNRV